MRVENTPQRRAFHKWTGNAGGSPALRDVSVAIFESTVGGVITANVRLRTNSGRAARAPGPLRRARGQTAIEIPAWYHGLGMAEIEDLLVALVVLVDQEEGRQRLRQERIDQGRIAAEQPH